MRVDDDITKTVVFLGRADHGPFVPYGTGFIVATTNTDIADPDRTWQTVVTARHVIESIRSKIVHVRLNNHSGEARVIETEKRGWLFHPDNRIDIAVFPAFIPKDQFDILHFAIGPFDSTAISDIVLTPQIIKDRNVGIGDEVYLSGLFVGRVAGLFNAGV